MTARASERVVVQFHVRVQMCNLVRFLFVYGYGLLLPVTLRAIVSCGSIRC